MHPPIDSKSNGKAGLRSGSAAISAGDPATTCPPRTPPAPGAEDWRAVDELKACVTALLCHEARGGLCVLAGFLDLAQDVADLLDEPTLELLRGSNAQLERVTSLLQDLGNASRLRPLDDATPLGSLAEIVAELQTSFDTQFGPAGFGIRAQLAPDAAAAMLPAALTSIFLRALADSAARLDTKPVSLRAGARRDGDLLHLEMERPLPGTHPSLHQALVDGFARSSSAAEPQGGLALGQWIACRAARMLGGHLVMHHENGVAVRFHVELPLWATPSPFGGCIF